VLVGRDTRASGPAFEEALIRGLYQAGADAVSGGVLPTPAVALLSKDDCGAVISASHNPPEYNGVKLFAPGGRKLVDDEEEAIEELLDEPPQNGGQVYEGLEVDRQYVDVVCERFGTPLDGLRLVVDCANGAMYEVGPAVFERLGAHVVTIGNEPDGTNINVGCGATDLSLLQESVRGGEFDLGVAFDGDGDRMLAVDAGGNEVDGDQILAVVALNLGVDLVAVTQMTNLGFHRLMEERGVQVVTTDVGDRYVAEALRSNGGLLGGEQSGHLIFRDSATTGDGLLTAVRFLSLAAGTGRTVADLASLMRRYPQVMENVPVRSLAELDGAIAVWDAVKAAEGELADTGRVLVRASGTEPLVRVMVEAETEDVARRHTEAIAGEVRKHLGA
jgi:phosphoglucosamine mutase